MGKNTEDSPKRIKIPWPTKAAMEQVYAMNLWGGDSSSFYSGEGSHKEHIIKPYITAVNKFLSSFESPLVVCDLGCGDFNIGKKLIPFTRRYVAVDIVSDLIAYNQSLYKAEQLEFQCLDIAVHDLPKGDCVILRQVLQHLSNAEIQDILSKLRDFKYVILTEHIPTGTFEPNLDIISGQGTRLKKQSGVQLTRAPFHFKVKDEQQLVAVSLEDTNSVIVTTLYTIF